MSAYTLPAAGSHPLPGVPEGRPAAGAEVVVLAAERERRRVAAIAEDGITPAQLRELADKFDREIGGAYGYVAAALRQQAADREGGPVNGQQDGAANAAQHEAGRRWAAKLPKPAQGSRDAWARFDAEEERQDAEHEAKGGNR